MKKQVLTLALFILFTGCASVNSDWEKAQRFNNVYSYKQFLAEHSDSEYAQEAAEKLEMVTWEQAKQVDTPELYQQYISAYPRGSHVTEALANQEPSSFKQAKKEAMTLETPDALQNFLKNYPQTKFRDEAEAQIVQIKKIHKTKLEFKKHFETLLFQADYEGIEKLVDDYTQYKFVGEFIPKLEESIFRDIEINGVKDRYHVPLLINQGAPFFKATFRAHYSGNRELGSISAGPSFPGDTSGWAPLNNSSNPGDSSIVRFGRGMNLSGAFIPIGIDIKNYSFLGEGDENHLLTFGVIRDIGYVYLRGIGGVQGQDKKLTMLGR